MIYKNGDKYIGKWKEGSRDGVGEMRYKNGSRYIGQWCNGERHGHGQMVYQNQDKHIGWWTHDKVSQYKEIIFKNGTKYTGQCDKNNKMSGYGYYVDYKNNKYLGNFEDSKYEGQG